MSWACTAPAAITTIAAANEPLAYADIDASLCLKNSPWFSASTCTARARAFEGHGITLKRLPQQCRIACRLQQPAGGEEHQRRAPPRGVAVAAQRPPGGCWRDGLCSLLIF